MRAKVPGCKAGVSVSAPATFGSRVGDWMPTAVPGLRTAFGVRKALGGVVAACAELEKRCGRGVAAARAGAAVRGAPCARGRGGES